MNRRLSPVAVRQYAASPQIVRRAFDKQAKLLVENLHHPSLRAKKYDEANDLWQARVNRGWRFYFMIQDDAYVIVAIVPHPK
jgi:plasmid maintenance system killer protein